MSGRGQGLRRRVLPSAGTCGSASVGAFLYSFANTFLCINKHSTALLQPQVVQLMWEREVLEALSFD